MTSFSMSQKNCKRQKVFRYVFALSCALLCAIGSTPARAANLSVSTSADSGAGSLRAAIIAANDQSANPGMDTIFFNIPGDGPHTIQLASVLPDLSSSININGPGDERVVIRGEGAADAYRIFNILSGQTVGISNLTIANGKEGIGGGIRNQGGTLNLSNSTLNGNTGGGYGGALSNEGNTATATVTNCTFSENGGSVDAGGAIFNNFATINLVSCTISGNTARTSGGIFNNSGTVNLKNTIVAGNSADNVNGIANIGGNTPPNNQGGNIISGDPKLGALADNGGPTFTMLPAADSPAINAGTPPAPATDQRGVVRERLTNIDSGAVEVSALPIGVDFVVTTAEDRDDGDYAANDISLREAITLANVSTNTSTISFDIPGDGPHTIQPGSALPPLSTSINIVGPSGAGDKITISTFLNQTDYSLFFVDVTHAGTPTVRLSNLTLADNLTNYSSSGLDGGAINNEGILEISNCTLSGSSGEKGGAIYNSNQLSATNCTFEGNNAFDGGAIFNAGTANISNCTFFNNTAANVGGTLAANFGRTFNVARSLFVKRTTGTGTNATFVSSSGTYNSGGYNLFEGTKPTQFSGTGDAAVADLKLGALTDNGGPTATRLPAPDSPAIDIAPATGGPASDQRGALRPQGAASDSGAVEVVPSPLGPNFVVSVTEDTNDLDYAANDISLREAIMFANANPDHNEITFDETVFDSSKTITIGTPAFRADNDLFLKHDVTITGPAARVSIAGANRDNNIFNINPEADATFDNLTIASGSSALVVLGTANLSNSTITGSRMGIRNLGTANVSDSTISTGSGTGIRDETPSSVANVSNSTLSGNGTGIASLGGTVNATNSTISFNANGITGFATVNISNCTISGNTGSGLSNTGTAIVKNTIIVGGTPFRGTLAPGSSNNITTGTAAEAGLDSGGLKDNGGPTKTVALTEGSSAIDAGTAVGAPLADQRGVLRPQRAGVDIGAFELEPEPNNAPTVSDISIETDENAAFTFAEDSFDDGFEDEDDDTLQTVKIISLPASGVLQVGGAALEEGDEIARADLDTLVYTPNADFSGDDSFDYNASDGEAFAEEDASVNISVNEEGGETNAAPVASDASVAANEDTEKEIDLSALVADDNTPDAELIYEIVASPANGTGTVSIEGSIVTYTPPANYHSTASFTYKATDEDGLESAVKTVSITVGEENDDPVFDPTNLEINGNEGTLITFFANARDVDTGTVLTYSLVGAPAGATINARTGEFKWTPTEAQGPGTYTFQIKASDGEGGEAFQTVTINVFESNAAPVLASIRSRSVSELATLSFVLSATDSDAPADKLSFSGNGNNGAPLPTGASLNSATGRFSWTPSEAQGPGTYYIFFKVSDGKGGQDSESIAIIVNEQNQPPMLDLGANRTLVGGKPFSFRVQASDADLPVQGFALNTVNSPSWLSITSNGPAVFGTPPIALAPYNVNLSVRADDYHGGTTTKTIALTIVPPPVVWLVQPSWNASEGTLVYRLKNNSGKTISGVSVVGTLLSPVKNISASVGTTKPKLKAAAKPPFTGKVSAWLTEVRRHSPSASIDRPKELRPRWDCIARLLPDRPRRWFPMSSSRRSIWKILQIKSKTNAPIKDGRICFCLMQAFVKLGAFRFWSTPDGAKSSNPLARKKEVAIEAETAPPSARSTAMREVALSRFLAGGRWRLAARWLGLGIFLFGAGLLAWVFWQALGGFQNFTRPDYLSSQLRRVQGDGVGEAVLAGIIVFGSEFLRVMYLLLLGFLASVIAGKGIQFFAASEAVIDEAVVGEVE